MSGVAGAYFKVLALTMVITLTVSFFITWLVLPTLFLIFTSKTKPARVVQKEVAASESRSRKGGWIRFFVRHAYLGILFAVACAFVISILPGKMPFCSRLSPSSG
jgi:multidrug efflux pump subunit AcrB